MRNIIKESRYHLEVETGWTYWFHLKHSLVNSYKLIKISFKSLVHGILPFIWKSDVQRCNYIIPRNYENTTHTET